MTASQSRRGGSLITPNATGGVKISEATRKRSSASSAGENACKP